MTAFEFRGPENSQTGSAAGMTAPENSTEILGSGRTTAHAALLTAYWEIGSRKLNDCSCLSGRTRERQVSKIVTVSNGHVAECHERLLS